MAEVEYKSEFESMNFSITLTGQLWGVFWDDLESWITHMCIQAVRMCTCTYACACVLVYVCAYEHTRACEHMYVHITMRDACWYISLWLWPICDFNWLDFVHLNIYHSIHLMYFIPVFIILPLLCLKCTNDKSEMTSIKTYIYIYVSRSPP